MNDIEIIDPVNITEHVNERIAAQEERRDLVDRIGDIFDPEAPPDEVRPASDPAPYGYGSPPDTADAAVTRTDAEKIDDVAERLFGPPQSQQPKPSQQQLKPQQPARAEPASPEPPHNALQPEAEPRWTAAEVERRDQCRDAYQILQARLEQLAQWKANLSNVEPSQRAQVEWELGQYELKTNRDIRLVSAEAEALEKIQNDRLSKATEQFHRKEMAKLMAAVPDIDVRKTFDYARSLGFPEEEILGIPDHRHFLVLEESRRYREMMKEKKAKPPQMARKLKPVDRKAANGQSRHDSVLKHANEIGDFDSAKTKAALDRRIAEIFR